jgi:hypothetical protein
LESKVNGIGIHCRQDTTDVYDSSTIRSLSPRLFSIEIVGMSR